MLIEILKEKQTILFLIQNLFSSFSPFVNALIKYKSAENESNKQQLP